MREYMTSYERRECIKAYLIKHKYATLASFSDMFGVSKQTICNDIVFLSSRIPITTKTGPGGGVFLDISYNGTREYLTKDEEDFLLSLLERVSDRERILVENIINKFSVKPGT